MKKQLIWGGLAVAIIALLAGATFAQTGWGQMGPGWQGGPGWFGCPGMGWAGQPGPAQITEENAKQLAQQYADNYLKGFTVEKVLPFTGMGMPMYSVELKGPQGEIRTLHVNPWGNVMPFGGPWRRAG